jgi:hypothetical protein
VTKDNAAFRAVCGAIEGALAKHPNATFDEVLEGLRPELLAPLTSSQISAAWAAVKRAEAQAAAPPPPTQTTVPFEFVDAWGTVCRVYDHAAKADQRQEYWTHLHVDHGWTLAELVDAVAVLVKTAVSFPRPPAWHAAALQVRIRNRAREAQHANTTWRLVTDAQGDTQVVFQCARCEDTGWRPACGCNAGDIAPGGECPRHPREVHAIRYRQAVVRCACTEVHA